MFVLANITLLSITSSALILSILIIALKIFIKHENLVLEIANLIMRSYIIIHITIIIWIYRQIFILWLKI